MAEVINLASFDFDSTKLEQNLERLQKRMVELKKEQQEVSFEMKKNEALFKANAITVEQYDATNQKLFNTQKDLQRQQAVVNKEYNTTAGLQQQLIDSDNKRITSTQSLNNALNAQIKTIADARKNNSDLLKIRNQLDLSTAEGVQQLQRINQQLDKNNQFIKENVSAYEQQKINIGNYTASIIEAYKELEKQKEGLVQLNKELETQRDTLDENSDEWKIFNQQIINNNTQINILITDINKAKGEFGDFNDVVNTAQGGLGGLLQASSKAGGATQLLGNAVKTATGALVNLTKAALAFLASPIGIVLGVIAGAFLLIRNAMNRSEESTNKLKTAISPLVKLFQLVLKVLEPIGEFLIDGIVAGFDAATAAIQKTIALIGAGLKFVGLESAGQAMQDFSNSIANAANQARELALAEQELEKSQRKARLTQLQYQKEAETFRQIRDDENRTIAERIKANEDLGKVLEKQLQDELAIAKQALLVANLRIQAEGQTSELLDAQADALTNIVDIEERINGQRSEQLVNINSLRKEAHEKYMAQLDAQINKQKDALDLFIAQQGDRARTLQEQLDLDTQIADKQKAILDRELKAKKISYEKYQTEVLNLNNELANKQQEIIVDSAKRELDEFIKTNQSKLTENQLLTSELLQEEISRENAIQNQRNAFELEQFNQGIINETEYQDNLLAIKEEYLLKEKTLNETFAAQEKAQRELNASLEFESRLLALEENDWTEFERRQEIADQQRLEEKRKLNEQLAANLISQQNYNLAVENLELQSAQVSTKIDAEKNKYKLDVASQTFGSLAQIAGAETAAGKAFSIAQTTIDTYQSATAAYKSLAGIPVYGPVLGGIAAAAAVTSGLNTVRKIISTPIPSAASVGGPGSIQAPRIQGFDGGGVINDGFGIKRSNGDNVLITARKGEVILNEKQRDIIGGQLLSFAGVPGFATGGSIGVSPSNQQSVQNLITQGFDMAAITDAVREGAMEGSMAGSYEGSSKGSQDGIVDLSTNRMIQNQATF